MNRSPYSKKHLYPVLLLFMTLFFNLWRTQPAYMAVGWVGNMFPAGGSNNTISAGNSFNIYLQVWKNGVTPPAGRGSNINCTLHWGQVPNFGATWTTTTSTSMSYFGDVGNNDEYRATISPAAGLYEFTAYCTDTTDNQSSWQSSGSGRLTVSQPPNIPDKWKSLWVDQNTIAWNTPHGPSGVTYELHYNLAGNLSVPIQAGSGLPLTYHSNLTGSSYAKFPNINGYKALKLRSSDLALIPTILQSEAAVAVYNSSGALLATTGIQLQGVLDAMYTYNGALGITYSGSTPSLALWAPTAQSVTLRLYNDATTTTSTAHPMTKESSTGVWRVTGTSSWTNKFYLYEVVVYTPATGTVSTNLVTDPYSLNLSQNSTRSQIVNLTADSSLKPAGWDTYTKPNISAPEDMVVYEVHVRDFSINDQTVPAASRGKYKAFTYDGRGGRALSNGMAHLIGLQQAGLTHIHLLPVADIATINENEATRQEPNNTTLASYAANSDQQQTIIGNMKANDGFNWGYDPFHYGVPEGSYATSQNGTARVFEFREMVKTLNENGLRVVVDVVYNHTSADGQATTSVLDKIVPGYYYRYNNDGVLQTSSCCADTAAEFAMMEKLMVDTIVIWATAYKVDSFRFDLMNLHTVANMNKVKTAVQSLTLATHGVDGSKIYIYGEGWDFGSAQGKGLYHANQFNMAGTGIGTFNDRLRDAAHGGFNTDSTAIRTQGFANGLSYDWNGYLYDQRYQSHLFEKTDRLMVGLAGSLQNYVFTDRYGNSNQTGIGLGGAGYTLDPQETINYVSKHDNETLYDLNIFKAPAVSMTDRVRIQNLELSLVGFSQGIPFFDLGSDMLRSKSLDRNSYDSGDWFNKVDFTYQSNNFGVGLPPAWDNSGRWGIMQPLLGNNALKPTNANILNNVAIFKEILQIRRSSKLFRLETAADVNARVKFHNVGPSQKEGLIVMTLSDAVGTDLDPTNEHIIVLFNANKIAQTFTLPSFVGMNVNLHPILVNSADSVVRTASFNSATGTFTVPARTTAVFVSDGSMVSNPGNVSVTFNVNATTTWGQNVFVVGNIPALGSWNTANAVPLGATNYPVWSGTVSLPASTAVQYKYIKKDGSGNVIWESGNNRSFTTPAAGSTGRNDTWQ